MDLILQDFSALQRVDFYWEDPRFVFCIASEVSDGLEDGARKFRVEPPDEVLERVCGMVRCCLPMLDARSLLHFSSSYDEDSPVA